MNKCEVLVACALAVALQLTFVAGTNYTVGAPGGSWDLSTNYTKWVSDIVFYPGDNLIFSYQAALYDVWEVRKSDYEACTKASSPLNKYGGGLNVIALTEAGSKYFYCSVGSHCSSGMKLAIIIVNYSTAFSLQSSYDFSPAPPSAAGGSILDEPKYMAPIVLAIPLVFVVAASTIVCIIKRWKNKKKSVVSNGNENLESNIVPSGNPNEETQSRRREQVQVYPNFDNREFTCNDLKKITNGFKDSIGAGGYGRVYFGILQGGTQVAVKMHSQSSSQGAEEFLAEAENLARVHHKNLVSLMGYCIDKNCMALVYEYMQEGNLYDKLRDEASPLDWKQRLGIAYESALGLEYLHNACNPPLIHRDVKTSNILLGANLEAKISDFGLSKAFNIDVKSHVTTRVVGTPGYMDPEYYISNQLKAKSDVFSFGVVLLEIITGQSPVSANLEGGSLVLWVRRHLSDGNIEGIVDPKMQNQYDINSVRKVADLACKCTEHDSSKRPTMSAVVMELHESLNLEVSLEETRTPEVSQNNIVDTAYNDDMSVQQVPV